MVQSICVVFLFHFVLYVLEYHLLIVKVVLFIFKVENEIWPFIIIEFILGEAKFLGGVAAVKGVKEFNPEAAKKRFFEIYLEKVDVAVFQMQRFHEFVFVTAEFSFPFSICWFDLGIKNLKNVLTLQGYIFQTIFYFQIILFAKTFIWNYLSFTTDLDFSGVVCFTK